MAEFPAAPSQAEWMRNRRAFSPADGIQHHFVAISDERIVGYASAERRNDAAAGRFRLFVVMEPAARAALGSILFATLRERLISLGARHAWMLEYESDVRFIAYLEEMGFVRLETLSVDGIPVVQLVIDAPFQMLLPQN